MCEGVYLCESILTGDKFAVKILNRKKLKSRDERKFRTEA